MMRRPLAALTDSGGRCDEHAGPLRRVAVVLRRAKKGPARAAATAQHEYRLLVEPLLGRARPRFLFFWASSWSRRSNTLCSEEESASAGAETNETRDARPSFSLFGSLAE